MARKKVNTEPVKLFDTVVPTGPVLSTLGIHGRIISTGPEYVLVIWNKLEFKTDSGLIRLPNPHRIKRQGVSKID